MEKKLYYKLDDGDDISGLVLDLSGCMAHIEGEQEDLKEGEDEDRWYTLTPIWMTDEEFDNLPEYEG